MADKKGSPEQYDFMRAKAISGGGRNIGPKEYRVQRFADETLIVERGKSIILTCHTRDLVDPEIKRPWFFMMSPFGAEIVSAAKEKGLETHD